MNYEAPICEILNLNEEDVIRTSLVSAPDEKQSPAIGIVMKPKS